MDFPDRLGQQISRCLFDQVSGRTPLHRKPDVLIITVC